MGTLKFETFTEPKKSPVDIEALGEKRVSLMTIHLNLMQEQLDLPKKISSTLLKLNDYHIDSEEGDHMRAKLNVLEERNRTIHLSIQNNLKELKDCETSLEESKQSMKKAA
jgi:hypothetical protein